MAIVLPATLSGGTCGRKRVRPSCVKVGHWRGVYSSVSRRRLGSSGGRRIGAETSEARQSDSEHGGFDIEEAELDCPQAGKVPYHPAHVRLCASGLFRGVSPSPIHLSRGAAYSAMYAGDIAHNPPNWVIFVAPHPAPPRPVQPRPALSARSR